MPFVDTNVLLYAISSDEDDRRKSAIARQILDRTDLCLSTQVLGEFYVQATRQTRLGALRHDQAERLVRSYARFPVQSVTTAVVMAAVATKARYQISYWDAAVIEASRTIGATTVLSEDMREGMDFDGVTVDNPFRD